MPVELPYPATPDGSVDATAGGPAANSYETLEEADAYLAGRLDATAWTSLGVDDPKRAMAALTATGLLEAMFPHLPGTRASADQRLRWPRVGVVDADGFAVTATAVPALVKEAQSELMLALLSSGDSAGQSEMVARLRAMGIESGKVGPLSFKFASSSASSAYGDASGVPSAVLNKLRLLLAYFPTPSSFSSHRVVRC
jgi:hypothetical protein